MPTAPSSFMKTRAESWITPGNTVRIFEETVDPDPAPDLTLVTVVGYDWTGPGLARQVTDARDTTSEGRQFGLADVKFWLKANDAGESPAVERDYRVTVIESGDVTLVGRSGTVETVERDPLKAVARIYVRMDATS